MQPRRMSATLLLTALGGELVAGEPPADWWAKPPAPTTTVSSGTYQLVDLTLSADMDGAASGMKAQLGLRDGRMVMFWPHRFSNGHDRTQVRSTTVVRDGDRIRGGFVLRGRPNAPGQSNRTSTWTWDLTVKGGEVGGTYQVDQEPVKDGKAQFKGTATGILRSEPAARDVLANGSAWPQYHGPEGTWSMGRQPALIEDANLARPVWRSEAGVLGGYGNGPDSRYFTRAMGSGNVGGGSSPIVADGLVFMHFYRPSENSPVRTKDPYWVRSFPDEAAYEKMMDDLKADAVERGYIRNHFRAIADDVIVAMDARTGATVWTAVMPQREQNLQTHKHRGRVGVPVYRDGTLVSHNLLGRVYALDAKTGVLRWEFPKAFRAPAHDIGNGPTNMTALILDQTVIHSTNGGIWGLDPMTGAIKWSDEKKGGVVKAWTSNGVERLLVLSARGVDCREPASGKVLWSAEASVELNSPSGILVSGDRLVFSKNRELFQKPRFHTLGQLQCWLLSSTGMLRSWEGQVRSYDAYLQLSCHGNAIYVPDTNEGARDNRGMIAHHLETGALLWDKDALTHKPGSGAHLIGGAERGFYIFEGQHGTASIDWLDTSGAKPKTLTEHWQPPHVSTTGYDCHCITYPIVDGRIFMRGGDAIYCYDLRK